MKHHRGLVAGFMDEDTVVVMTPDFDFIPVKTNGQKFELGDEILFYEKPVKRKSRAFSPFYFIATVVAASLAFFFAVPIPTSPDVHQYKKEVSDDYACANQLNESCSNLIQEPANVPVQEPVNVPVKKFKKSTNTQKPDSEPKKEQTHPKKSVNQNIDEQDNQNNNNNDTSKITLPIHNKSDSSSKKNAGQVLTPAQPQHQQILPKPIFDIADKLVHKISSSVPQSVNLSNLTQSKFVSKLDISQLLR